MKWKLVWFGIGSLSLLATLLLLNRALRPSPVLPTLAALPSQTGPPAVEPIATAPASTLTSFVTIAPSATITDTPIAVRPTLSVGQTGTPPDLLEPLEIQFDGIFSLPLEQRRVVEVVLNVNRRWLPPETQFTVSAYRDVTGWAKVTLVPTRFVESSWSGVETIAPFVVQLIVQLQDNDDGHWNVYLVGSPEFNTILPTIPPEFVDFASPIPALTGDYLLPWPDGQTWWATNGWHGGNAIDFQPGLSARFGVIAAQSGVLSEICSDGYQSLLQILHADGRATYYLHVTMDLTVR
ncbi:MAG: hypothetical protein H7175_03900, partial [Burkholderiales bacterium]|nr:hypothetical protein [Anaerolineae bacterium]